MSQHSQIIASIAEAIPSHLKKAVLEELKNGYQRELVNADVNRIKIAQDTHSRDHKSIDGIGRLRMRVDPTLYHHWGAKYGYGCWRDNGFLKEVERDNPEVRVKCGGTRLQIGYSSPTKFSKNYGAI
jgi:hypothetical protein